MNEFTLHDGTDTTKTDELHKFLDDMGDRIFEWDGEHDGINLLISINVRVGDTIVDDGDNIIIRRKPK
jgi:hypothetical protein